MARSIPPSIADVVEQLELEGAPVVTVSLLQSLLADAGKNLDDASKVAYELKRAGWLGSLHTRGAWEFLPGSRAGAYSSGDRFIEFRAQLTVDPEWPGVLAMESAASALGLAQRIPEKEVVALPPGTTLPKALTSGWRSVAVPLPDVAVQRGAARGMASSRPGGTDLPTWTMEGLIAGIAIRPTSYRDVPGLAQWLAEAVVTVDVDRLKEVLIGAAAPVTARQRAAFLLGAGGNDEACEELVQWVRPRSVAWFGSRRNDGVFEPRSQVNDTVLHRYLDLGGGA